MRHFIISLIIYGLSARVMALGEVFIEAGGYYQRLRGAENSKAHLQKLLPIHYQGMEVGLSAMIKPQLSLGIGFSQTFSRNKYSVLSISQPILQEYFLANDVVYLKLRMHSFFLQTKLFFNATEKVQPYVNLGLAMLRLKLRGYATFVQNKHWFYPSGSYRPAPHVGIGLVYNVFEQFALQVNLRWQVTQWSHLRVTDKNQKRLSVAPLDNTWLGSLSVLWNLSCI